MSWLIDSLLLKFSEYLFPKRLTVFMDLPDELMVEVLASLEVIHILKMRQVCRRFDACTREKGLWRRVVVQMAQDCALSPLPSVSRLSSKELEQFAIRRIRAKQRVDQGLSRRTEMQSRRIPIRVSNCHLVPGGHWLLAFTWDHEVYCLDLDNWTTMEPILLARSHDATDTTAQPFTAVDYDRSGRCSLVVARMRSNEFNIEVYSLDFTQSIPSISLLGTIAAPQGNGSVLVSGPYITRTQKMRDPFIECFNWQQYFSRKRFDYTAIIFSPQPSRLVQSKKLLSNGLLMCESRREIFLFKFNQFQPLSRFGETDPTPAVPYWWYTPDDLRIPTWPPSATLLSTNVRLQSSSLVGSIYLTGCNEQVFRVYLQKNGEPVVQRVSFEHYSDFFELGWESGFRVWKGHISSLRVGDDSVIPSDPIALDVGIFISTFFSSCHFDEFSGRISLVRSGQTGTSLALVDLVG